MVLRVRAASSSLSLDIGLVMSRYGHGHGRSPPSIVVFNSRSSPHLSHSVPGSLSPASPRFSARSVLLRFDFGVLSPKSLSRLPDEPQKDWIYMFNRAHVAIEIRALARQATTYAMVLVPSLVLPPFVTRGPANVDQGHL